MERAKELPDKDSSVESAVSEASDASVCAPSSQKNRNHHLNISLQYLFRSVTSFTVTAATTGFDVLNLRGANHACGSVSRVFL